MVQAEAACGGSKWRNTLYLDRAELLWLEGKTEEAFREYQGCLKDAIEQKTIDLWFPKLRQLKRENEVNVSFLSPLSS